MKISDIINQLEKLKEEKGDQELFMWVDSGQDTVYLVKTPELIVSEIDGEEYLIPKEFHNENNSVLVITNLESGSFDEDTDAIDNQDMEDY